VPGNPSLANLAATAEALLAAYVSELTALGITLPDRQYVAPGTLVPWDGDQLVVNISNIQAGHPGAPSAAQAHPQTVTFYAEFGILLVRQVAGLTGEGLAGEMVPYAADLDADGQIAMSDASALVRATVAIWTTQTIAPIGMGFVIGACTAFGPEGGLCGWRQAVEVSLD
jgi:hypothetical protein